MLLLFFSTLQSQQKIILDNLKATETNFIFGNVLNLNPGDTISIPAGNYGGLKFYDINGLPGLPITIINEGGKVEIAEHAYSAFELQRCSFVHITGSGAKDIKYGFNIKSIATGAQGMNLTNFTTDVEVDHVEISKAGFAGIMAKTDPNCNDSSTFRDEGFVMRNINIHHNRIHHTQGEGIYIGYTGNSITHTNRYCNGTPVYAHWLEDVTVSNNSIHNTGLDGIQLNLVRSGGVIRDNRIVKYATKAQAFQDFAMSVGVGQYDIYNNKIVNKDGYYGRGMQFLNGFSGSRIFNNVFVETKFHAIFIHNRHEFEDQNLGYIISNNTLIRPEDSGIFYNTVVTEPTSPENLYMTQDDVPTYFVNNLIVDPGRDYEGGNTWKQDSESYIDFNNRSTRDAMQPYFLTNLFTRDIDVLLFKNLQKNNFRPAEYRSPLVDSATDVSEWNINFDFKNKPRPSGSGYDIGAFEIQVRQLSERSLKRLDLKTTNGDDLVIDPNPSSTQFQVSNGTNSIVRLLLYNDKGVLVKRIKKYTMGNEVEVTGLLPGTYYLKLVDANKKRSFGQVIVE